jgi:Protein of unknown function (DUF4238)
MPAKKSQHYVPRLLLRRFAVVDGRWQGHIFRLERHKGRVGPAVPRSEAAKNRYYDLPDDVVGQFQPENVLERIENDAALVIRRVEQRQQLQPLDVVRLAYFFALQTVRTPQDRAERRYLDGVMATQLQEIRFSARDQAVAFLREHDPTLTLEEAEEERQRIIDELRAGRIRLESTADREVAGMFLGLNDAVTTLASNCDWTLVAFSDSPALVLPDTGYTRYDPAPSVPGSASGFLGSQRVETVIPVRQNAALVVTQGTGVVRHGRGTASYADDLNLRAYAQSDVCIYGQTQQAVVDVHRLAKKERAALMERRRRPRTLWIGDGQEGDPDREPILFTGYSIEGIKKQLFHVDSRARVGKGVTPDDMWK